MRGDRNRSATLLYVGRFLTRGDLSFASLCVTNHPFNKVKPFSFHLPPHVPPVSVPTRPLEFCPVSTRVVHASLGCGGDFHIFTEAMNLRE